jgi:hypothetical protein
VSASSGHLKEGSILLSVVPQLDATNCKLSLLERQARIDIGRWRSCGCRILSAKPPQLARALLNVCPSPTQLGPNFPEVLKWFNMNHHGG